MRRRRATSRKPAKAQQTIKAKRGTASKPAPNRPAALSKNTKVARLARELRDAREQQAATSEVLSVISSSPGELEPVFETMLANATRICEARFGNLLLYDGTAFRVAAMHGAPAAWATQRGTVIRPDPRSTLGRVARTKEVVHTHDLRTTEPYLEGNSAVESLADRIEQLTREIMNYDAEYLEKTRQVELGSHARH